MKSVTIPTRILENGCDKDLSTYLVLIYNGIIYMRETIETNEWNNVPYELETYTDVYCFNYAFNFYKKRCLVTFSDEEDMERYKNVYDESEKLEDILQ